MKSIVKETREKGKKVMQVNLDDEEKEQVRKYDKKKKKKGGQM